MEKENSKSGLSRRTFFKGAAVAGAVAAAGAAVGCAPSEASSSSKEASSGEANAITQRLIDRGVLGANLPEAAPIMPVEVPASWDDECDVIVVGMGGGGLVAAGYLAESGKKVIGLEKQGEVGGASRHACSFVDMLGGVDGQAEAGWTGLFGGNDADGIVHATASNQWSVSEAFQRTIMKNHVPAFNWITKNVGDIFVCGGALWQDEWVVSEQQNHVMGMNRAINALEAAAKGYGADIRVNSKVTAFVTDGEGVVGVQVGEGDSVTYIKANDGVILSAGGIGMNKDLIKAYLPSIYEGAVLGGPMPMHTGEIFRMGLGMGADFSGYNSWCCWEGAIQEPDENDFWHYFWHGERQLFHNPWLIIDKYGNRQPYYGQNQELYMKHQNGNVLGDLTNTCTWVSAPGHHVYSICDAKFPEDIYKKKATVFSEFTGDTCRVPVDNPDQIIPEAAGLVTADWVAEVEEAVERGAVKKADTIEELAEMLGLDPERVTAAVENYNRICDQGFDDEMAIPYDPSWLTRIDTPPYYAAVVGGQIGKTLCGLRVNSEFQVSDEEGNRIPGLYASFSTMGGMAGESNFGDMWNGGTYFGGVGASLMTGWVAAQQLLENE